MLQVLERDVDDSSLRADKPRPDFIKRAQVVADLSALSSELERLKRGTVGRRATEAVVEAGEACWVLRFHVHLFVAETSLKAKIVWEDRAVSYRTVLRDQECS